MNQMEYTVTKGELAALLQVVDAAGDRLRSMQQTKRPFFAAEQMTAERERLRVARRAIQKVHKLYKFGVLQEHPQTAGAPANCRSTGNLQVLQVLQVERKTGGGAGA